MEAARRVDVELVYEGVNISRDIAPFFVDLTYTDNAHGEDDDLQITLEDREGKWRGSWFPERGAPVRAALVSRNWEKPGVNVRFPCGTFEVDEIECSGPPTVVKIKAVSSPVKGVLKRELVTKAWEAVSLSEIASELAGKHGLGLVWESGEDPVYERKDQVETADLVFLRELCEEAGAALKTTDAQLVVFSEEEYEKKPPSRTITPGMERLSGYRLRAKTAGTYKAVKVQYHDAVRDETFEVYTPEGKQMGKTGETLVVNRKVDSLAEAERLGKKKLYDANKREMSGSFSLMGDFQFVGGSTVKLSGWGKFDGVWFVERATHKVSRGGYTTDIDIRMGVKEGS